MKRHGLLLIACLLTLSLPIAEPGAAKDSLSSERISRPKLQIETAGNSDSTHDSVSYSIRGPQLRIIVLHKRGIGKASISLVKGQWPAQTEVVFQDFSELEGLSITYGAQKTELHSKAPPNGKNPFHMQLRKGQMLLTFPSRYMSGQKDSLQLFWIDYYR